MKKTLSILAIILILAIVVAPFGFGFWAEKRMQDLHAKMAESCDVIVTVVRTERGWFSSEADVLIEVSGTVGEAYREYQRKAGKTLTEKMSVKLRYKIHHGPFVIGEKISLMPAVGVIETTVLEIMGEEWQAQELKMAATTRFELLGGGETEFTVGQWSGKPEEDGPMIAWQGLEGEVEFSAGYDKVEVELEAPSLTVEDEDVRLELAGIEMEIENRDGPSKSSIDDAEMSIKSFSVTGKKEKGKHFSLQNMRITSDTELDGDVLNYDTVVSIEALKILDQSFGPGKMTLVLRNLNESSIGKIESKMKEISCQGLPEQQQGTLMASTLLSEMQNILRKGPVLEISELYLETPDGKLESSAKLTVSTDNPAALSNPFMMMEAIKAEADVRWPETVLIAFTRLGLAEELAKLDTDFTAEQVDNIARNRVRQRMQPLVDQGMFVFEDGVYRMSARFENSTLTVNGQVMPIPGLGM